MPFFSLPTGGSPVLAGVTAPTGGVGNVGDLFIETSNKLLYGPKEAGGWPTGPIDLSNGPTGPTGPTGDAGGYDVAQLINARTADYTLVLSDAGKLVTMSSATGTLFLTLPPASSVAFATGTHVDVARIATGAVTITGATGVTVHATPGQRLRARYSAASCVLYAGDTWLVVGDTTS